MQMFIVVQPQFLIVSLRDRFGFVLKSGTAIGGSIFLVLMPIDDVQTSIAGEEGSQAGLLVVHEHVFIPPVDPGLQDGLGIQKIAAVIIGNGLHAFYLQLESKISQAVSIGLLPVAL